MMILEEAITHAEKRASADCSECAKEHAQLAEWLKELKSRRGAEIQTREATEAKPCPVDRGKLMIGLECCRDVPRLCEQCPYYELECDAQPVDALAYIGWLEERV